MCNLFRQRALFNTVSYIFLFTLASSSAYASFDSPSTQEAPVPSTQDPSSRQPLFVPPPGQETQTLSTPPLPGNPTTTLTVPIAKPFRKQVGVGFTAIPTYAIWHFPGSPDSVYQGGLAFDVHFRIHPRVTLELSLSGTGAREEGGFLIEWCPILFGVRAYLRTPPQDWSQFHFAPYLVFAGQAFFRGIGFDGEALGNLYLGLGLQLGGGFEFRLNEKNSFYLDGRGVLQVGNVSKGGPGVGGIRAAVGFSR